MEKIFDIVSSFIPDEQKDDIKSKIDGKLESGKKTIETSLKKDLSKTYGVNFFEEDIEKAFDNKLFIKREMFDEKVSALETLTKENEVLLSEKQELLKDKSYNEVSVGLLSAGFNPERLDGIRPLIKADLSIEENVNGIKAGFPELFSDGKRITTIVPGKREKGDEGLTDAEKFIRSQQEKMKR